MQNVSSQSGSAGTTVITPQFLERLAAIGGTERLLDSADELLVYECDGYVVEKTAPDVVVFGTYSFYDWQQYDSLLVFETFRGVSLSSSSFRGRPSLLDFSNAKM